MPEKGKPGPEAIIREVRRKTRRRYSAEEKIRIVLEGLRGEESIAELCRREGIDPNLSPRDRLVQQRLDVPGLHACEQPRSEQALPNAESGSSPRILQTTMEIRLAGGTGSARAARLPVAFQGRISSSSSSFVSSPSSKRLLKVGICTLSHCGCGKRQQEQVASFISAEVAHHGSHKRT
jgi:transposase-like protein